MTPEQENEQARQAANAELRALFEVPADAKCLTPQDASRDILYGRAPDESVEIEVGGRKFGAEFYVPQGEAPKVWVVAQHGYAGRARDYSKLAELLNAEGIGVVALDMHAHGKNDTERMSMRTDEWADVAAQAPELMRDKMQAEKLIFIGQSSGGSGGAGMLVEEKTHHPYDGAVLIGPTLITVHPELVEQMDTVVGKYTSKDGEVMIDFGWLAPLMNQMHDERLNRAYQTHFTTTPGFPYRAAREAIAIPRERIIDRLGRIDVPTIMVKGEHDHEDDVSLKIAQEELVKQSNQNIEIRPPIQGAGHQAHIEKPEVIAQLIKELLSKSSKS